MKKIMILWIIGMLLMTSATTLSGVGMNEEAYAESNDEKYVVKEDEIYSEVMPYWYSNEYGIDFESELEMDFESEEYERLFQPDDDVELLWSHSGEGKFVFSALVNDDDTLDILASSYAIDGATGETIFQFEAGAVIGVGDVNNDVEDEIISYIGDSVSGNSTIYCLDSSNGIIIWERVIDSAWVYSVSIGDITGDVNNEVIVGVGDFAWRNNNYVYCLDGKTGDIIWRKLTGGSVQCTKIADVNADDKNEVVAGTSSNDPRVYCLEGDAGDIFWEFVPPGWGDFRLLCIGELNDDPYKEIAVEKYWDEEYGTVDGIYCLSGNDGSVVWSWIEGVGSIQSIQIADMVPSIPGNEVIAAGCSGVHCLYGGNDPPLGGREIWHAGGANGIISGFVMSAAVGDLDKDGFLDVTAITTLDPNVYALKGQYGSLLWRYENCETNNPYDPAIICADLTGDGFPEVIAKDDSYVCALLNSFPSNNLNPNIPTIDGPTSGYIYLPYDYIAVATDPDADDLYYYFDWGDGTGGISKVGDSGEIVTISNIWKIEGNYTIRAKAIDEHGAEGDWSDVIDVVMIYVPSTVNITKPEDAYYINNQEIMPTSSPIIIGDIDINVDAIDDIYGIKRVEFYIDDELRVTDFTEPYSWTWDESGSGNHTIKVVAINSPGIQETDEITVWKSSGGSELDQYQTEHNRAIPVGRAWIEGGYYVNFSYAQSFIPSKNILTKIYLCVGKLGASSPYVLAIRENLTEGNLATASVNAKEIGRDKPGWIEFDFGELEVNPGHMYYMVSYAPDDDHSNNLYCWCTYHPDVYPNGSGYKLILFNRWMELPNSDFCFRIYGRDSLLPNTPALDGPTIGKSGEEYEYMITAEDPDEDQLYYYVDWGENNYGDWIGPYNSGETAYARHTWMSPGIYEVKVIAKDDEELLGNWSEPLVVNIINVSDLKSAFLFGFISDLNEGEYISIFRVKLLAYVGLDPPDFKIYYSGEGIAISNNYLGYAGQNLVIGRFNVAIISETQTSTLPPMRHNFRRLLSPFLR